MLAAMPGIHTTGLLPSTCSNQKVQEGLRSTFGPLKPHHVVRTHYLDSFS